MTVTIRARILVVLGTRPEAIKLFPVIRALGDVPGLAVTVCATGQHRDLATPVMELAGIRPDIALGLMRPGQDLNRLSAALLDGLARVIADVHPDWVMVQGDTTSALCGALAAFHARVPVAHVEAGLRSGDLASPFPEEANRRMIGTVASLHFAPTPGAADALRREGVDQASIHVTGNTGIDALLWMRARLVEEPDLGAGIASVAQRLDGRRLIAVTCHRRENIGSGASGLAEAMRQLAGRGDCAFVLPLHPNPAVREPLRSALDGMAHVTLSEPLDYPDFVRLLDAAHLILTDSGGVQEEAPMLGKPILVLRDTTERPEGVAAGAARVIGTSADRIVRETARLLDDPAAHAEMAQVRMPYGDGAAAARIVQILSTRLTQRTD